MNIIEAVKNGKFFKRKHWNSYLFFFGNHYSDKKYLSWKPSVKGDRLVAGALLSKEDIVADDWIFEEKKRKLEKAEDSKNPTTRKRASEVNKNDR